MKLAQCREFTDRRFRVIYSVTGKPVSGLVGDIDAAMREMENACSAQGCSEEIYDLEEVKCGAK